MPLKSGFNPRICKRCDKKVKTNPFVINVSIHASVKDATLRDLAFEQMQYVSIHASVKDATSFFHFIKHFFLSFNPRICKRCDKLSDCPILPHTGFNPRICKRCDLITNMIKLGIESFNPRICKRCDGNPNTPVEMLTVSIHASVKDATRQLNCWTLQLMFQSTHL